MLGVSITWVTEITILLLIPGIRSVQSVLAWISLSITLTHVLSTLLLVAPGGGETLAGSEAHGRMSGYPHFNLLLGWATLERGTGARMGPLNPWTAGSLTLG